MKFKANYSVHTSFLIALFLIGNAVITIPPASADDKTFLGFIVAFLICLLAVILLIPIISRVFDRNRTFKTDGGYYAFRTFSIVLGVIILFEAARCFYDYVRFASSVILSDASSIIIAIIFIAVTMYLCRQHSSVILKFSLFSFIIVLILAVCFFIMSAKEFRIDNIFLLRMPTAREVSRQTIPYLKEVFLPVFIVLIYVCQQFSRVERKQSVWGLLLGTAVLTLCLLNSVLLFGASFCAELGFPYASAISTVTVGYLFSRMDGFSYFIYFACCLVKTAVCINTGIRLIKKG